MAEKFEQAVIIKKIKKGGEAAHGGSWKVAYADFVTAMLAVFLLLWLLNMTSAQKKAALSQYFQNHSIFEKGGGSAVGKHSDVPGQGVLDPSAMPTAISQQKSFTASDIAKKLQEKIQDKKNEFKDRVFVINDNGNLRIEITDDDGSSFYAPGGIEMNENGRALLNEIATLLVGVDTRIMVEGHTDASAFKSGDKSNWDLSRSGPTMPARCWRRPA
jgi:chemotaxis protein MotB